jgi:hypothetical protein
LKKGNPRHTSFLEEINLCGGKSRIDILVVGEQLHGIEIKSDRDHLNRLERQLATYNQVVSFISIVGSMRTLEKIKDRVADHVGLIMIGQWEETGQLFCKVLKKAKKNPYRQSYYIAQLLHKNELVQLLRLHGAPADIVMKTRQELWQLLVQLVNEDQLVRSVAAMLRQRYINSRPLF